MGPFWGIFASILFNQTGSKSDRMKRTHLTGGLHSVRSALKHGAGSVIEFWIEARRKDGRIQELIQLAGAEGIKVQQASREQLDVLAPGINHQGVVVRTLAPATRDEKALREMLELLQVPPLLLILDGVQDPHNLGACLRSADAAGVHAVITPKDRSAGLTPTACKVASGAAEFIPFVQVTNLVRALKYLKEAYDILLVGTAEKAESSLFATDLKGPLGIVMGGEKRGMRRLTRETCDLLAYLPMAGSVESLNISVACGISLFEAVRQRMD